MWLLLFAALWQNSSPVIPMNTLAKGSDSQIDEARQLTARSAAEWETLWRQHAGARDRPSVYFAREMVVAVFLGARPTAGFGIEIVGAREDRDALVVQYRESRPRAGSITAQVLTAPYHLVLLPMRGGVVRFEKIE